MRDGRGCGHRVVRHARSAPARSIAGVVLLAVFRTASAQPTSAFPRFPVRDVRVEVELAASGARIHERFELTAEPGDRSFRVLVTPCATLGEVAVRRGGRAVAVTRERQGPWVTFRETSTAGGADAAYEIELTVALSGTAPKVPLAVPLAPFADDAALRAHGVAVEVQFDAATEDPRVVVPRMERATTPGRWRGRYLALPSFVRVSGVAGRSLCEERSAEGNSGGLPARFWAFVGVLVLWVPLYLWWVSRDPDPPAAANARP